MAEERGLHLATGNVEILGLLELSDTASGFLALDAMTKAAPIIVLAVFQVNPGKVVICIGGDVASVEIALHSGERAVGRSEGPGSVLGSTFIPHVHASVADALSGRRLEIEDFASIAILDVATITAAVRVADMAAKQADVTVAEIRAGNSMGGRGSVRLTGDLTEIETAVATSREYLVGIGQLVSAVTIPNPHADLIMTLTNGSSTNDDR
jgi:microcompartment protein CcmL/EutN